MEAAHEAVDAKAAEARSQQQVLILQKDAEAERRVFALQVKALEETVARQTAHIAALEKQLGQSTKPLRTAKRTSSPTLWRFSFSMMRPRCASTV